MYNIVNKSQVNENGISSKPSHVKICSFCLIDLYELDFKFEILLVFPNVRFLLELIKIKKLKKIIIDK